MADIKKHRTGVKHPPRQKLTVKKVRRNDQSPCGNAPPRCGWQDRRYTDPELAKNRTGWLNLGRLSGDPPGGPEADAADSIDAVCGSGIVVHLAPRTRQNEGSCPVFDWHLVAAEGEKGQRYDYA